MKLALSIVIATFMATASFQPAARQVGPVPLSDEMMGLGEGGLATPGVEVVKGPISRELVAAAQKHAEGMAASGRCGHQGFAGRVAELRKTVPNVQFAEIAAESWPWQANASMKELGVEAFKSWNGSPGHWATCKRQHALWGGGMAKGKNGVWYFCIITAD